VEKVSKRDGTYRKCVQEGCDWRLQIAPPEGKAAAPAAKGTATKSAAKKKPAPKAKK
jgi:DNA topoisomerase-1